MTSKNQYILQDAAVLQNPITFTAAEDDGEITLANLQLIIDLLSNEGSDEADQRLFLDEMSPAARASMIAILLGLQAVTTAGA